MNRRSWIVWLVLLAGIASDASAAAVVTLQDAYTAALSRNESVQISEENRIQADSRVDQAKTYLYPRLSAQAAYTRYNDTLPSGGGPFLFQPNGQFQVGLVLTQPLYTGGRTMAALRVAETMQESSRNEITTAQQNIMMAVAESYYAMLKAQQIIDISKDSLERMIRHKKVAEQEAATRISKATASALLRANTLVDQAKINLLRAEDGLKIARQKLRFFTNLPDDDFTIAAPAPIAVPAGADEALREEAYRSRQEYVNAQLNTRIAKEMITVTEGGHYPQVYAEAGARYQESDPKIFTDATTYYAGLRLQIPIFEGGLMKAELSEARSRQRQSELASVLIKRNIENEVREATINCQTINSILETAKVQLEYAKKNFDTVEALFAEGLVPSLSLIDGQQALSFAERELVTAIWDQQLAVLRLQKSLGSIGKQPGSQTPAAN